MMVYRLLPFVLAVSLACGEDDKLAQLELSGTFQPEALDFGDVEVGAQRSFVAVLKNTGEVPLFIEEVEGSWDFDIRGTTEPLMGLELAVSALATVEVTYAPTAEGPRHEVLRLRSDDGSTANLTVRGAGTPSPLGGLAGGLLGALSCRQAQLDLGEVERGDSRYGQIDCAAEGGPVRITNVRSTDPETFWALALSREVRLATGSSVSLPVRFDATGALGLREAEVVVDLEDRAGERALRVSVSATVLEPRPTITALRAELTWDTEGTDLDLHLTAPEGEPMTSPRDGHLDPLDCSYADLWSYGGTHDDWGVRQDEEDDCFLDRDDVDGLGPERINLSRAAPGVYKLWVHYFANHRQTGGTRAEVVLLLGGQPVGAFSATDLLCNDLWHVGDVIWDGSSGTFEASDRVTRAQGGDCS